MLITRKAEYAMQAICYLTEEEPFAPVSTQQMADDLNLSPAFMSNVITSLSRAGIVRSMRGIHGGIVLNRPPDMLSLLDVLEAAQGELIIVDISPTHPLHAALQHELVKIQEELIKQLRKTSFATLMKLKESRGGTG